MYGNPAYRGDGVVNLTTPTIGPKKFTLEIEPAATILRSQVAASGQQAMTVLKRVLKDGVADIDARSTEKYAMGALSLGSGGG